MAVLPIGDLLSFHAARKDGEAVAIRCGSSTTPTDLTWRELDRRSNRRARLFMAAGVLPDDLVLVALGNGPDYFETTFAIWKAGATPLAVSPKTPAAELRAISEAAHPRLIVSNSSILLPEIRTIDVNAPLDGYSAEPLSGIKAPRYWKAMTSGGSTGQPKVIIDHKPAERDPHEASYGQSADGVVLNPGPLHHNGPFLFSHSALFAGSQIICMDRFDAEDALRLIERNRVQWTAVVPTMMSRIMALPESIRDRYDLRSLERVLHFAAPINRTLKTAWLEWLGPDRTIELYAATEAVGATLISGSEWLLKPGSVGRPMLGTKIKIVDDDGHDVPSGIIGEIYMMPPEGPRSSYHYLGAERRIDLQGWESVGDLGWLDEDGYLFLAERRSDLIIRGGANIFAAEIEGALEQFPGVRGAVVVGLPDPDLGQRAHAILETDPDTKLDFERLAHHLLSAFAKYKSPESYEIVTHPLRDDAGKVRRSTLREDRAARLAAGDWLPPIQIRPFATAPQSRRP